MFRCSGLFLGPPKYGQQLRGRQNISRDFRGGGGSTLERALQTHFWRAQKVELVWSVLLSSKGNDKESLNGGGERNVS